MAAFKRFRWERVLASDSGPASATTRHVLLTLGIHADRAGKAFPSIKTLAVETALSERAVVQHVQAAVRDGWLIREKTRREGQGWRRSTYWLSIPAEGDERRAAPFPAEGSEPGAACLPSKGTDVRAEPSASDAQGVDPKPINAGNHGQSNNVLSTSENNSKSTTSWKEFAKINGIIQAPGEKDLPFKLRVIAARSTERKKAHS